MFHPDHLSKAREYSNLPKSKLFYFKHMWWALHLSATCLVWTLMMFVHAIIPNLVGFTVIESMVKYIMKLKELHPDDPLLKHIEINDDYRKTN